MPNAKPAAVAAHMPGLVFRLVRDCAGRATFPYLSEGCQPLLGVEPERLRADPALLAGLVLAEDRPAFDAAMEGSAAALTDWNWEGRIRVDAWNDVKWISVRATPRSLSGGALEWDGIMTNVSQRKREERAAAELARHADAVREEERARIAREVHDELGGNLTAIKMALALLRARLPGGDGDLAGKTDYVEQLVDRTIEAAHRIALDLRPPLLDLGIVAALEWQTRELEKQAGIAASFRADRPEVELAGDRATALLRIVQEALTNVAKHAAAGRVEVRLAADEQSVSVSVSDDGRGLRPEDLARPAAFGIRGMHERARLLGGSIEHGPGAHSGCCVRIKIARTGTDER